MAYSITCCAAIIDDAAQYCEQIGRAMNFIDHHELALLRPKKRVGIVQAPQIQGTFQIEIQCAMFALGGDALRQGGFAYLARAEEDDRRHLA